MENKQHKVLKLVLRHPLLMALLLFFYSQAFAQVAPPGNCLNMNGFNNGGYVELNAAGTAATNFGYSSFTIESWVRPSSGANSIMAIFGHKTGGSYMDGFSFGMNDYLTSNGRIGLEGKASGIVSIDSVFLDRWSHVAASYSYIAGDSGMASLYINGKAQGSGIVHITPTSSVARIGCYSTGNYYWFGGIDELRVWNIARTLTQLQSTMFDTVSSTSPNLVAYYRFDQGIASGSNTAVTTLTDQSGHGYNGTLNSVALTGSASNFVESYAMVVPMATPATNKTLTSFTANWTPPLRGIVNNYFLDVSTNPAFTSFVTGYNGLSVPSTSTSQAVTGLSNNTSYYYRVSANKTSVANQGGAFYTQFVQPGNCLNFDGTNDYVEFTNNSIAIPIINKFSVEAWVLKNASGNQVAAHRYNPLDVNGANGYSLEVFNGYADFVMRIAGVDFSVLSPTTLQLGKWAHLAGTWDGTSIRLYVNGVLQNTVATSGSLGAMPTTLRIGGRTDGLSGYWNGNIDEVRFWGKPLSASEILANALQSVSFNAASLQGFYKFDQGTAGTGNTGVTSLTDATISAKNGTLYNFSLTGASSNWVESYSMAVPTATAATNFTVNGFTANWTTPIVGIVDSFIVDVSTSATFATAIIGSPFYIVSTANSLPLSGLNSGTTYYYRVRANKSSVNNQGATFGNITVPYISPTVIAGNITNIILNAGLSAVVDTTLAINTSNTIPGANVTIITGLQAGDTLSYTGTLPSGVTAGYVASIGVLTFTGAATASQYQALLRTVMFKSIISSNNVIRNIAFTLGKSLPFNGHFYEYVASSSISYTAAKTAASSKNLFGLNGYLGTMTSAAENAYVFQKLNSDAWMGASDAYDQINAATGTTTYANQTASEGNWYWVTGPEAGSLFSVGNNTPVTQAGKYANWYAGEPNNYASIQHYGVFHSSGLEVGKWDDYPVDGISAINGYICEYGGMTGDQTVILSYARNVLTTQPVAATVITQAPSLVSTTSATLGGNVSNDGGAAVTERGIVYSTSLNPTTAGNKVSIGAGTGIFSQSITGLTGAITYHVRAYAINGAGTSYGADSVFITLVAAVMPSLTTTSAALITAASATLGGTVTSDGGAAVIERGIVYSTSLNPTTSGNKVMIGSGTGAFTQSITGLTGATIYHVRAYAINNIGTAYGADSMFTTLTPSTTASVITASPALITTTSATLGGNVINDGNATITERGIVYSTSLNPTTTDNKVSIGTGIGVYTQNINGLTGATTYHVRAYVINNIGTAFGADSVFTTLTPIAVATVSTASVSPALISIHSTILGGNVTASGGATVNERGVVYATGANPTIANTKVMIGAGIGSFSQSVTGLTAATTYHVRAYAINSVGISYGGDSSFTTMPSPSVSDKPSGVITPNGDGSNDYWIIDNWADLKDHEIVVFDIFGQEVFHQTGYDTPWDGKKDGNVLPSAEYYYMIKGSKVNLRGALLITNK